MESLRALARFVCPLYLPAVLCHGSQAMTLAILPRFVMNHMGGDSTLLGVILAFGSLGLVFGNLPGARCCNLYGSRATQILSAFSGFVGALLGLLSCSLYGLLGIFFLMLSALCIGISASLGVVARTVYLETASSTREQAWLSAWLSGMGRFGNAGGVFLGSVAGARGIELTFIFQVLGFAAYGCVVIAFLTDLPSAAVHKNAEVAPLRQLFRFHWRPVVYVGATLLTMGTVREGKKFLIPLIGQLNGYELETIGFAASANYILELTMTPIAGVMLDHFGKMETIAIALATTALGIMILCSFKAIVAYIVSAILAGIGYGMATGAVIALSVEYAPQNYKATFIGLCRTMSKSADVFVPAVVGFALQVVGSTTCGIVILVIACSNALCVAFAGKTHGDNCKARQLSSLDAGTTLLIS